MPPPANDERAAAEEVPFGAGSGTVSGTTVDATEDAGGPFDGYGAQDVYYVWTGLAAGTVDFTITPTTPGFAGSVEAWFNNVEPTDWIIDDSIASGNDVGVPFNVNFEHPGGTLTLAVFTYTGDPGGGETDFDFDWAWTAPSSPPGNDDRVDAELVPVVDYWGIVTGTTQGATRDSGAGFADPDIKDVWYYWDDLPEGIVYLYVKPDVAYGPSGLDTRFDAWLQSVTPTSWTSDTGATTRSGGQGQPPVQFQHAHPGGDLTLAIATYSDGAGGPHVDFTFGWGHTLDPVASHWGVEVDDEWVKREATVDTGAGSFNLIRSDGIGRQGRAASSVSVTPSVIPPAPSLFDCLFENASFGVTGITMVGGEGCEYQGPSGGEASGTDGVGAFYQATGSVVVVGGVPSATTTEDMTVTQTVLGFRFEPASPTSFRGPLTEAEAMRALAPSNFDDYDTGSNPDLVWGFEFVDADPEWETRNVTLGDYRTPYDDPPPAGLDELGPNTVTMRTLPQSVVVAAPVGSTSPNRVSLDYDTVTGADIDASYITPGVGTHLETLEETLVEVVFSTFTTVDPLFVVSDVDEEWLLVLNISAEVLVASPPPVESVADGEDWISSSIRAVLGGDIAPGWDARAPTWRAYRGFLFEAVTPGWRVGRVGWGSSPW